MNEALRVWLFFLCNLDRGYPEVGKRRRLEGSHHSPCIYLIVKLLSHLLAGNRWVRDISSWCSESMDSRKNPLVSPEMRYWVLMQSNSVR